jgi:hypothetical protein
MPQSHGHDKIHFQFCIYAPMWKILIICFSFQGQQVVEEILDSQRPGCPIEYFNIPVPPDHPFRQGYWNNNEFTVSDPRYIGLHVCTRTCCLGLFGEYPVLESYLVLGNGISKVSSPCRNGWSGGTGILKYSIGQPGRCESKISSTTCCPWKEKQIINIFHIDAYIQNWKCILSCAMALWIHDRSFSWLDTCTSKKSGEDKLILLVQTSL